MIKIEVTIDEVIPGALSMNARVDHDGPTQYEDFARKWMMTFIEGSMEKLIELTGQEGSGLVKTDDRDKLNPPTREQMKAAFEEIKRRRQEGA